jgi:type II secretory pathway component GspD/PulD (secretin)
MVVTANGEAASIDAGDEQNFLVATGFAADIRTIRFGSIVEMTPRYDASTRRIEISVTADISELTPPNSSGIPGRTRTTISAVANLELGQSLVLGGLESRTARESAAGLPGLSQIPILGVLFGTNNRTEARTENFLFIIPTVVQAVPRGDADRVAEALRVYQDFGSIGGHGLDDIELVEPTPPGYE